MARNKGRQEWKGELIVKGKKGSKRSSVMSWIVLSEELTLPMNRLRLKVSMGIICQIFYNLLYFFPIDNSVFEFIAKSRWYWVKFDPILNWWDSSDSLAAAHFHTCFCYFFFNTIILTWLYLTANYELVY